MSDEATATPKTDAETPAGGREGRQVSWGVGIVVVLALTALFWPRAEEDRSLPQGTVIDADGQPIELVSRVEPVTLVHFWSTWCLPCLDEVPKVLRLEQARAGDDDFTLMMIAVSDDRRAVEEFVATHTADRRHLLYDDWTVTKAFGTDKLPETHLVVDGMIVHTFVGVTDWDDPQTRAQLDRAVANARAAETG